jgi:hypothetical protein
VKSCVGSMYNDGRGTRTCGATEGQLLVLRQKCKRNIAEPRLCWDTFPDASVLIPMNVSENNECVFRQFSRKFGRRRGDAFVSCCRVQ